MKVRPIIFRPELAQAIAEGRKTQTRRIVKLDHDRWQEGVVTVRFPEYASAVFSSPGVRGIETAKSRHGGPGGYLYAREAWRDEDGTVEYRGATPEDLDNHHRWRPSIHMPRRYARTWLRITDVRVERVQDISEEDAQAEGVEPILHDDGEPAHYDGDVIAHRWAFIRLWNAIHGDGAWERNDWVWVYTFERCERP